jgi:hypothetical protein
LVADAADWELGAQVLHAPLPAPAWDPAVHATHVLMSVAPVVAEAVPAEHSWHPESTLRPDVAE